MKDRRLVDELSIEELERILLIKRREARLARLRQMDRAQHVTGRDPLAPPRPEPASPPISTAHRQYSGVGASQQYRTVEVDSGREHAWSAHIQRWLTSSLHVDWRFVFNRVLLFVELVAIVGLAGIAVSTWHDQQEIRRDATAMVAPPVATALPSPTPQIKAVVLPGGHTPPDPQGVSRPVPIPEHTAAEAQQDASTPLPTQGPEHARRIVIPAIGVDHRVVEGDDWEALKQGVGHTPWSANPGEVGNCVLSGYNDVFGEVFRQLSELALGDEIFVHTGVHVYRYVVQETNIVEPDRVEVMGFAQRSLLTLISSYPYMVDDQRVVVVAELE